MAEAREAVPIQKRIAAWGSSIVLGVAMYAVFGAILTAGPARDSEMIRGEIAAIPRQPAPMREKMSREEAIAAVAEHRATASALLFLSQRRAELEAEIRAKGFWAAVIGVVAGVGGFALCSAYWLQRGAKEVAVAAVSAPAATGEASSEGE